MGVRLDQWACGTGWNCDNFCINILSRNSRPIDAIYSVVREMADPDDVRLVSP